MRSLTSKFLLAVLLASTLFYVACEKTTISKINNDPERYRGKEVGVVGTVTDSYGVPLVGGAYELDDGTGKIWVVSRNGAPRKGTRVGTKGRVHSGMTFGSHTFGTVIEESDRRVKN